MKCPVTYFLEFHPPPLLSFTSAWFAGRITIALPAGGAARAAEIPMRIGNPLEPDPVNTGVGNAGEVFLAEGQVFPILRCFLLPGEAQTQRRIL
jgi:hypothetical protein